MSESHDSKLPPGLLAPVPRRVRMASMARQPFFILLGVLTLFVVGVIGGFTALGFNSQKPMAELQQRGVKAEGKVTNITSTRIRGGGGSYSYTAYFQFPVASGGTATGTFGAGPGHTQVGDSVPVIYLPENPSIYVVAQEITADEISQNDKELTTAIQAGMVLCGLVCFCIMLAVLPGVWSDFRELRFARWAELVMGHVETVTATGYTYAYELPKLGRIEEKVELGFAPEQTKVGQQIPILYSKNNPRRRKPVSSLLSVEFLPPKR